MTITDNAAAWVIKERLEGNEEEQKVLMVNEPEGPESNCMSSKNNKF